MVDMAGILIDTVLSQKLAKKMFPGRFLLIEQAEKAVGIYPETTQWHACALRLYIVL